jgi:hypothetical protein
MRSSHRAPGRPGRVWPRGAALALALVLPAAGALAQVVQNAVAAAGPTNQPLYEASGIEVFDRLLDDTATGAIGAVSEAIRRSQAAYEHYTVYVDADAAAWSVGLGMTIESDADITILGSTPPLDPNDVPSRALPQDVVIVGDSNAPVIDIVPPSSGNRPKDNLVIEGVTIRGGEVGVQVRDGQPTLNRVYVTGNFSSGVVVQEDNGAEVLIVNSSIAANGHDGVQVRDSGFARVLLSTLYANAGSALRVYADQGADARVENTIVMDNDAGLNWTAAAAPIFASNDVYRNNGQDYINVAPAPDDLSIDAGFADVDWLGQLDVAQAVYTVVDRANTIYLQPFTARDFEGQIRPIDTLGAGVDGTPTFDIGADELSDDSLADIPIWYECNVFPNPVPASPPGAVQIEVRISGTDIRPSAIFMVPQGHDPLDVADRIPFEIVRGEGLGRWWAENVNPIQTILEERDGSIEPSAIDLIADGHAVVYVEILGRLLGTGNDDSLITDQARVGRHVIIDTIAPRVFAPPAPGGFSAANLVRFFNAAHDYTTLGTVGPSPFHPATAPAPPAGWLPATSPFKIDDGLIQKGDFVGPGASAFFNVGSLTNFDGTALSNETHLLITVDVPFEDPTVEDSTGTPVLDPNGNPRVVAGFPIDDAGVAVSDTVLDVFAIDPATTYLPAWWVLDATEQSLLAGLQSTLTYSPAATATNVNIGFDPADPTGEGTHDYGNREIAASWSFPDDGGAPGISVVRPLNNGGVMDLSVEFQVRDRAGNRLDPSFLLEPLNLVWLLDTGAILTPNVNGQSVPFPFFDVTLDTPWNAHSASAADLNAAPRFLYRLYESTQQDGPYAPITAWTGWPAPSRLTLPPLPRNRWILIVALAADSAGNLEPWPDPNIDMEAPTFSAAFPFVPQDNWQRFRTGGDAIDTTIRYRFWHNDIVNYDNQYILGSGDGADFGTQTIIPTPPDINTLQVEGRFEFEATVDDLTDVKILVYFYRDGQFLDVSTFGYPDNVFAQLSPNDFEVVALPGSKMEPAADLRLEDTVAPRLPRRYTLQAWAFIDADNDNVWDPPDPAAGFDGEIIDQTPASVTFTVVPETSAADFIRNRASTDRQPIKIQEEQQ